MCVCVGGGGVNQVIEPCPKLVNLFILVTPKCAQWQTVETEMKCLSVWYLISVYIVAKTKTNFRENMCGAQ